MFVRAPVTSVPNESARRTTSATFALKISFLLGRQLMFGHDPPIQRRSTTAVRRPLAASSQVIHLPASPLPITRTSSCSGWAIGRLPFLHPARATWVLKRGGQAR